MQIARGVPLGLGERPAGTRRPCTSPNRPTLHRSQPTYPTPPTTSPKSPTLHLPPHLPTDPPYTSHHLSQVTYPIPHAHSLSQVTYPTPPNRPTLYLPYTSFTISSSSTLNLRSNTSTFYRFPIPSQTSPYPILFYRGCKKKDSQQSHKTQEIPLGKNHPP